MRTIFTLLLLAASLTLNAQTTEYTTGQTYGDAWTGWSTPVTSNVSSSSVNGADIYVFSGTNGQSYTVEMYRQFNINSNDIDLYLAATCENATVSIELSQDNVSYTQVATQSWGAGFSQSTIIAPTIDPISSTFYLKIVVSGTFGSPSQLQLNNFKIDAILSSGSSVSITPTANQNIGIGVNGTTLTANESPSAASSREWMSSTTPGSGYTSFSPVETGTTYTPNFASAGTYYVVCESDFSGTLEISNEVRVIVSASAGIGENENLKMLQFEHHIAFNEVLEDATVAIFDLSGREVINTTNMKFIDISSLKGSNYIIRLTQGNEVIFTQQFAR